MKRFLVLVTALLLSACSSTTTENMVSENKATPQVEQKTPQSESVAIKPVTMKELEKLTKDQSSLKPSAQNKADSSTSAQLAENYKIVPEIDLNEWKLIGTDKDVKTYQKKQDLEGLVAFRGETIIPTSILKIAAVFDDPTIRKDWIEALVVGKVIAAPNRLFRVEYNHTAVPWPFQDRDFIYDVKVEISKNPNSMILRMKNGNDALYPPRQGVVRGKLVYCYYHMKELEPGKSTYVIVEIVVDPMGNIPKWLVNLTSRKWPQNTLANLREVSQRDNLKIPADLQQYYSGNTIPGGKQ